MIIKYGGPPDPSKMGGGFTIKSLVFNDDIIFRYNPTPNLLVSMRSKASKRHSIPPYRMYTLYGLTIKVTPYQYKGKVRSTPILIERTHVKTLTCELTTAQHKHNAPT